MAIAKRTCARCPVSGPCLDYALANRINHGVWGGRSERERRRLRKNHPPGTGMGTLIADTGLEPERRRSSKA